MQPDQYIRRVLIVVSGMSPQVLTETLYALACGPQPEFVPTEVHLLSTREGARHARLNLLEGDAHFHRLCEDYGLDSGCFSAGNIHVIANGDGEPLDDIRTPADNDAAADYITDFIRRHTADADAAVHVSMAGGRKTMGYYAGYALSLFGRDQDRLSHVLVSEGFESHRDFYYPTPVSRAIHREGKAALDAKEARVELASIPFVRLRDELPEKTLKDSPLLEGRQSFSAAVAAAEFARLPHVMTLDLPNLSCKVGDQPVDGLGSANFSFLAWLADRAARGLPPLSMKNDIDSRQGGTGMETGQDYARFCVRLQARDESLLDAAGSGAYKLPGLSKTIDARSEFGFDNRTRFETHFADLRRALAKTLGSRLAEQFTPLNLGKKGDAQYGFKDFDAHFVVIPLN